MRITVIQSYKKISPVLAILFFLSGIKSYGQLTPTYAGENKDYKKASEYYTQGLYVIAERHFNLVKESSETRENFPLRNNLYKEASLYEALSAVKGKSPNALPLVQSFIREFSPDPIATTAVLEIVNYYFNNKDYESIIDMSDYTRYLTMNDREKAEIDYKLGYAYFVRKQFYEAKVYLGASKDKKTEFYYPINYYHALTCFFLGDLNESLEGFAIAQQSERYSPLIPYYSTQIYFSQKKYDETINTGRKALQSENTHNKTELNLIIGQSYFELEKYEEALPYLTYFEEHSSKIRKEDYYQIGYARYISGDYAGAIKSLGNLYEDTTSVSQSAMLFLADSHLKTGDKNAARNAYKKATELSVDREAQETALLQYARLSAELGFNREAITIASNFTIDSPYYLEAQELLGHVLTNTKDYDNAIKTIENIANPAASLREAYQLVTYSKAAQLFDQNEPDEAKQYLAKSLNYPVSNEIKALTFFLQGQISYIEGQHQKSINELNALFTLLRSDATISNPSIRGLAGYIQGYNYLKLNNFSTATGHFQESVADIERNPLNYDDFAKKSVLPDALLRIGDCFFKQNNYSQAEKFYQQVIDNRHKGTYYATYQKAIIRGLQGKDVDKIVLLENIINNSPELAFVPEALYELSNTYLNLGKYQQATEPLTTLVTKHKNNPSLLNRAYLQLGLIAYNQSDYNSALAYYKKVFEHNPTAEESSEALKSIEEILVDNMGQPSEYIAFLEKLPGLNVTDRTKDSLNYKVANSQYESGEFSKAISSYSAYLKQFPNGLFTLDALYNRAESYLILNDYPNALKSYEQVLDKGPSKYFEPSVEKAAIIVSTYKNSQDFKKALKYYSDLEAISSDLTRRYQARLGALNAAYRINSKDKVIEYADKIIRNPTAPEKDKSVAHFYRGKAYYELKEFDDALEDLNQVLKLSSDEKAAESRYRISEIYFLRKDIETAELLIQNAASESEGYPYWVAQSLLLYSDILAEKGDFFNASAALEAVIENFHDDKNISDTARRKLEQLQARRNNASKLYNPSASDELDMQD